MIVAAIDQGTSSSRAVTLRDGETPVISERRPHRQARPAPGRVEHDPEELLSNVRELLASAGPVDAIGLCNQGESCLAWDAVSGEPLSPVIVWQDSRTAAMLEGLAVEGSVALMTERANLPLDPYFSASKLGWLMAHNENVQAASSAGRLRMGTTDAFFLDRLAGTFATDASTASRTGLLNTATLNWDEDLCRLFGIPPDCLPPVRKTADRFGEIGGIPVTASVVDQQAALYGHGCRVPGEGKITFGTGAFALVLTEGAQAFDTADGLLPTLAWSLEDGVRHALDAGLYDAGSAVDWAARIGIIDGFDLLDPDQDVPAIAQRLIFVPALSGLACPYWDRSASALWLGMGADTSRRDMAKAVFEGIALSTAQLVAAMSQRTVVAPRLSVDGGLTRSNYFMQFLADVLGREVSRPAFDELTGLGGALLAARGAGYLIEPAAIEMRTFTPRAIARDEWLTRFSDAVARSRGWRS